MLKRSIGKAISGRLIYRRSEHSLDVEPNPGQGVASLLVNDVQIEMDCEGLLTHVWGLCPHESWMSAKLEPPTALTGRLQYVGSALVPGVSKRLNPDKRWAVGYDEFSQWLCIGDQLFQGEMIAFSPGAVAALKDGELVGLWLHPDARR